MPQQDNAISQLQMNVVEAEFLDELQIKVFRVFLLAIHSRLQSFAMNFFISSNSRNLLQFLEFKKPVQKPQV